MLNLGDHDDSSEEDEAIVPLNTAPSAVRDFEYSATTLPLHLFKSEEEEDEEDAPLPSMSTDKDFRDAMYAETVPQTLITSQDFTEAFSAVATDPWDCLSWIVLIEEAEQGRGGSMTPEDAYIRFTTQFPRAHKYWNKLIQIYLQKRDFSSAEAAFSKCLNKSRNVDLWLSYIDMVKLKFSFDQSVATKTPSQLAVDRQTLEVTYEKAVQSVGMAPQAGVLWRTYLDFVRDWPEAANSIDSG